jgi:hypothetical protein
MAVIRFIVLFALLSAVFSPRLAAQSLQLESYQGRDVASGEILVKFRTATGPQAQALAIQDADITSTEPVGGTGAILLRSRGRGVPALLQAYRARQDVLYAEPNYVGRFTDVPNDALFNQQWGLRNTGQTIQTVAGTAGADIGAATAWNITGGSRNNVVALVDSGFDYKHPDLAPNAWSAPSAFTVRIHGQLITCAAGTHGFNAMTRTCDPMDHFGHGTHVAGIIGASGNNGIGVTGVSRVASIMGIKLGDASFTVKDVIAAMEFVQQVKALFPETANIRVLNASWGVAFSQTLLDEINLVSAQDILFVAAAGNSAANNDLSTAYPANYPVPGVVSVAATDNRDALAVFSQWGPTTVDLSAPGVNILSTLMGGTYGLNSGTSMATPMVTGAAALVLSACPMTTAQLKANLMSSVDEIPALAERVLSGGRLNVLRALSACAPAASPTFTLTVSPGVQNIELNQSAQFTVTAVSLGGFSNTVDLEVTGLPTGMTAAFLPAALGGGGGVSTLTLTSGANTAPGTYLIGIKGTSGSIERTAGLSLGVGIVAPIGLGETLSGTLAPGDRKSQGMGSYADLYALTLTSTTLVDIDLKSTLFNGYLYLLTSSGTVLFSNDTAQGTNPRITATLNPGVYWIEATTVDGLGGKYTFSINTPTISSLVPRLLPLGGTSLVTLTGTRFSTPMTIEAGSGITVTNIIVVSPVMATATFAIAADAVPGPKDITVTTAAGVSNPMMFPIPARIDPGQTVSGSVSNSDLNWPNTPYRYSDLHQLTIDASTQGAITIEVTSSGFDSQLGLFSATGAVIAANNNGGGLNKDRLASTLSPGVYFMEVTSAVNQAFGDYVLSVNPSGLTGITPPLVEQGGSTVVNLAGTRFASPMTIDAGPDIVAGGISVTSPTSATATLTAGGGATIGEHVARVTTPSGTTNSVPIRVVPPIPTLALGALVSGTLSASDAAAYSTAGARMDLYRFTLTASSRVVIALRSTAFDPLLVVRNATSFGTMISLNDSDGSTNARTTTTLAAGSYLIEATSFLDGQEGAYELSLELASLNLISMTPRFGTRGASVSVSLSGVGLSSTMTIDAGPDIVVSNTTTFGTTTATATFSVAAEANLGLRDVKVITSGGTSNALPFTVYDTASIALGETKSGALTPGDQATPSRTGQYGDLFRFTLGATTPVAIDVKSSAFNSFVYLLSSTGSILASDDSNGGGTDARIATGLAAGTYFIEVTSSTAGLGNYTVSAVLNPVTLNFPRALSPADMPLTGFAIVNPGPADAAVTFNMFDQAGSLVGTANETIPARGQFSKLASELFPSADRMGWVQARSETIGLQGLWLGGDFATVMDGAEAAPEIPAGIQGFFPLVTPQTEVHIANPGTASNSLTFSLFSVTGALLAPNASRSIPPNSVFRGTLAELFPVANPAAAATVRVTGTQRFAGLTVALDYVNGPSLTVLNAVNGSSAGTQANFPHVVSGGQGGSWTSMVGISNLFLSSQTVTISFTPPSGSVVSVTRTIPPFGALRESAESLFSLPAEFVEGSLRVVGTGPLSGFVAYGFSGTGGAAVVPAQAIARSSMIFSHVATGPGWSTGLALLNTTTATANVQVSVMRRTGALVGSTTFTLPAGAKLAKLIPELVPSATFDDGFVFVRTTNSVPIFGIELFFSRDLKIMANVAAGVIDPTISYTPPAAALQEAP